MLRFVPRYQPAVWGARRLESCFGRSIPDGPIGESWELADIDAHRSRLPDGAEIGELWRAGVLGGSARGTFPLMLKWLDTADRLSVQVHPDEVWCEAHGRGAPKTEAWLVAGRDPDAYLYLGHRPGLDEPGFRTAVAEGEVAALLGEHRPGDGECLLVPAGTLHAIGPGYLLLEVQQPSDTTFRAYDWGRVGLDGKPRELHLDDACSAVHFDRAEAPPATKRGVEGGGFLMRALADGEVIEPGPLRIVVAPVTDTAIHSAGGETRLARGDVVVAKTADGPVTAGPSCVLVTEQPV